MSRMHCWDGDGIMKNIVEQTVEFDHLATNHIKLVPDIMAGGAGGTEGGGIVSVLLANMLRDSMANQPSQPVKVSPSTHG
jgi:hypothetical protein